MNELLELVASWGVGTLLTTAALFGFFPKFVAHLIVLVYPQDHPRRRELPADIEVVPYRERMLWVFGECAVVLFEGVPLRVREIRERRREGPRLRRERPETDRFAEYLWSGAQRSRRRSIGFSGTEVTISAAIKDGVFGGDRKHTFSVTKITSISNSLPGFSHPGRLTFTVDGASTDVVENPVGGGDRVDMNTFCYSSLGADRVRKLVAEIRKAMEGA